MSKTDNNTIVEPTFLDELNYKVWATKESRFNAYHRLLNQSKTSHFCQRILLIYYIAIVFGAFYHLGFTPVFDDNVVIFSIIFSSLFLAAFSRIENAKSYPLKAKEFYNSSIELSSLYNVLKIFSSLIENQPVENKKEFAEKIATSYQRILELHQNHEPIDAELFKSKTATYHNLSWLEVQKINVKYYIKTLLPYHLLILVPPLVLVILYNR